MKGNLRLQSTGFAGRIAWRLSILIVVFLMGLSACTGVQATGLANAGSYGIANTGAKAAAPTPATMTMPAAVTTAATADANEKQEYAAPKSAAAGQPPAESSGPKAYIGLFKDNAVAVLDTGAGKVIKTIPVPTGPHGLVISPDGRWVYVSSDGDTKVSLIDTTSDTVVKSIEVGKMPHGLALTPDGKMLLAAVFGANQVAFIDTASGQVVGQVSVPSPHNIAISPDGYTAYVAAQKKGAAGLSVIDIGEKKQDTFISLDKAPRALNFSPDGKLLYFTQAGVDAVQALDPATNQITGQIGVGASPHHPIFLSDGSMALVVSQGPGELDFIAPQTGVSFLNLAVGKMPHWIAVNPEGTTAWVTNEGSNTVSVVDLKKFTVTATIPVGNAPRKMVVQPGLPASAQTPTASQAANSVAIAQMAFGPDSITIKAGQTITWTNQDAITHTVTDDKGGWDSGPLAPGKSYSQTFAQPGQYTYHCTIHPFMTGTITVTQ